MNNYSVFIKEGQIWQQISGKPVYPFCFSHHLDERLDEAYIEIIGSDVSLYTPMTEIKISIGGQGDEANYYMVIANDKPQKIFASGKYNHTLYVVERTKILSGIYCSSITFTNPLGVLGNTSAAIVEERKPDPKTMALTNGTSIEYPNYISPILTGAYFNARNKDDDMMFYIYNGAPLPYTPTGTIAGTELANPSLDLPGITPCFITIDYMNDISNDFILKIAPENSSPSPYDSYINVWVNGILYKKLVPYRADRVLRPNEAFDVDYTKPYIAQDAEGNEAYVGADVAKYQTPIFAVPSNALSYIDRVEYEYFIAYTLNNDPDDLSYLKVTYELITSRDVYPLKKLSITDAVNRVLMTCEPLAVGQKPRFTFAQSQEERYSNIPVAELSLTQRTLREQLKEIGTLIHAEPRLDENDVIWYDEYASSVEVDVNGKLITDTATWDVNEYNTEIRSNAQNLVNSQGYAQGVAVEHGLNIPRTVRTETIYARVEDNNIVFETQFPIYSVVSVRCGYDARDTVPNYTKLRELNNVTPYVYEETAYTSNLSAFSGAYPYSRSYALYYTTGSKNIKGITYTATEYTLSDITKRYSIANILGAVTKTDASKIHDDMTNRKFSTIFAEITYRPIFPTFVSHGKNEYSPDAPKYVQPYNQGENIIDTRAYGENLKGTAARLGNEQKALTFLLPSLADIPRTGRKYKGYTIASTAVDMNANRIKCTLDLTKAFNRLSQHIGVSSIKRMYEISERQVYNRDVLISRTVVFSLGEPVEAAESNKAVLDLRDDFASSLEMIFKRGSSAASVTPISSAVSLGFTQSGKYLTPVLLPVVPSAMGNNITFYFSYEDNYSAGKKSQYEDAGMEGGKWCDNVPYGDFYGELGSLSYYLLGAAAAEGGETGPLRFYYSKDSLPAFSKVYPAEIENIADKKASLACKQYAVSKDNREKISVTSEISFKSNSKDLVIGSGLAQLNPLVNSAIADLRAEQGNNYVGAILWIVKNADNMPNRFETRINPEEIDPDTEKPRYIKIEGSTFTLEEDHLTFTDSQLDYYVGKDVKGWFITSPSDKKITKIFNQATYEDKEIEEERGYNILLMNYAPEVGLFPDIYFTQLTE